MKLLSLSSIQHDDDDTVKMLKQTAISKQCYSFTHGLIMIAYVFATDFPLKLQTYIRCCTCMCRCVVVWWCDHHDHAKSTQNFTLRNIFFLSFDPLSYNAFFCSAVCMHYDYIVKKPKKYKRPSSIFTFHLMAFHWEVVPKTSHGTVRDLLTVWNVCEFNRAIWVENRKRDRESGVCFAYVCASSITHHKTT